MRTNSGSCDSHRSDQEAMDREATVRRAGAEEDNKRRPDDPVSKHKKIGFMFMGEHSKLIEWHDKRTFYLASEKLDVPRRLGCASMQHIANHI